MAQPEQGAQQRPGVGPRGEETCGALALGLGAHDIHVHQGLADTILNAMQRFDVETLRQARKQLAQSACHFIKRAGGRPDDLGMSACRQQQK